MPDPDHKIIEFPFRYAVVGFNFQRPQDGESFIDLTLRRGDEERRLRFFSPQRIELEEGFPICSGLEIKDVSGNQLDGLNVRVDHFEASFGAMRFWAREVIDLDVQSAS